MAHEKSPGFFRRLVDPLFEEASERVVVHPKHAPSHLRKPLSPRKFSPGEPSPGLDATFHSDDADVYTQVRPSIESDVARWDDTYFTPAPQTGGASSGVVLSQVAFAAKLNEVIQKGRKGSAGKLQLLDLDEIKRDAGDRWEQIAEKAQAIAEQVIRHRLAASDVLAPYDESSFVILFAELNEEQARLKVAAISREVRQRLLGELGVKDNGWIKAFVTDATTLGKVAVDLSPEEAFLAWGRALETQEDCAPPIGPLNTVDTEVQTRLGEVGVSYWPTLMVPKNIIGIYGTYMIRLDALNRILSGPSAYPHGDTAVIFEMDRATVKRAIEQVQAVIKQGRRPGLIHVSLRESSLLSHSSGLIVDMFRALPSEFRRLFIVGVNAQEHGTPLAKLMQSVGMVQPFCRTVTVQVPTGFLDFERLARAKISAVGIDLEEAEIGGLTPERLARDILPLSKAAAKAGLHSYLYGIKQRETAKAARDAGFTYLNGPAVIPTTGQPIIGQSV